MDKHFNLRDLSNPFVEQNFQERKNCERISKSKGLSDSKNVAYLKV